MPTAYNPASTLDRPYGPGEFAHYAETTGPGVIDEAQYMEPDTSAQANYSSHPTLQVEAERRAASDLAMPTGAYSSDQFHVPQSAEVNDYEAHVAAEAAALEGGVENMLSDGDRELNATELGARFDAMATSERRYVRVDAMAPNPEASYSADGALLEAYRAGCAIMPLRRLHLQNPELN